ncbi:MAG: hypothetical protein ABIL43_06290, partial [candidate division WOR-3 bacterium]
MVEEEKILETIRKHPEIIKEILENLGILSSINVYEKIIERINQSNLDTNRQIEELRVQSMERIAKLEERLAQIDMKLEQNKVETIERIAKVEKLLEQYRAEIIERINQSNLETNRQIEELRVQSMERIAKVEERLAQID